VTLVRQGEYGDRPGQELTVDEEPRDVGVPFDPAEAPKELVLESHRQILYRQAMVAVTLPRRDDDRA
jgi:hypothetical protein